MSPSSVDRDELVTAARAVAARGLSHGSTGNVSLRVGGRFLVTPTGSSLATVQPDELAVLNMAGHPQTDAPPSKEAFLHAAIYRNRPQARAVVHTHSLHATAVSCLAGLDPADALPTLTAYYAMRVQALPLTEYCAPGDQRLADLVGALASTNAAMLLANHGPVVAASTPQAAVDVAEEIEHTAKLFLLLHGQKTSTLTTQERLRLFAHYNQHEGSSFL
jgi:ribulose-5-phosphate 4-epimerase/fuculose-1-phosphate aldolase